MYRIWKNELQQFGNHGVAVQYSASIPAHFRNHAILYRWVENEEPDHQILNHVRNALMTSGRMSTIETFYRDIPRKVEGIQHQSDIPVTR